MLTTAVGGHVFFLIEDGPSLVAIALTILVLSIALSANNVVPLRISRKIGSRGSVRKRILILTNFRSGTLALCQVSLLEKLRIQSEIWKVLYIESLDNNINKRNI